MRDDRYPSGTVVGLLDSGLMTAPTAAALRKRLAPDDRAPPTLLDAASVRVLEAVCARLIPQEDRDPPIDIAGEVHRRLADGIGDGWRYADMPPDDVAVAAGLRGIERAAKAMSGRGFVGLAASDRDAVLRAIQRGEAHGEVRLDRFFEELLAEVTDVYYSHPLAQEEIGFLGMADAPGWDHVGLGACAPHEPRRDGAVR